MYEELSLILRASRYQDASKVVTFFSREGGVRTGFARGATARDNRFGASLEPLTLCRISGRSGGVRSLHRIHHADILDPYRRIHADYNRLTWSGLVIRFLLGLLPPEHPEPALFARTIETLGDLDAGTELSVLLWLRFARDGLAILGYRPTPPNCNQCRRAVSGERMAFNPGDGMVLCRSCRRGNGENGIDVSAEVLSWMSKGESGGTIDLIEQAEAVKFLDALIREHHSRWIPTESIVFLPERVE